MTQTQKPAAAATKGPATELDDARDPEPVRVAEDSLATRNAARAQEFEHDVRQREARATANAALIEAASAAGSVDGDLSAWQDKVRMTMAESRDYSRTPRSAADDLQLIARPWPWQRVNVTPGQTATVDLGNGESHVGLGLYFTTGAAGGSTEMGGPFRLSDFSDFEFRTTIDYSYDWWFSTALGGADSQGWVSIIVDELLDAPGSAWHSVVNRRIQLWSDSTASGGSDGASDPGNRITVNERFRGRPDANYVWWIGGGETIQTEHQASSQANLWVDVHYLVFVARV